MRRKDGKPEKVEKVEKVENWASKPDSDIYDECSKLYPRIARAYENKAEQIEAIEEYRSIYNAKLDGNQKYNGNSTAYVPVVRDAVNARARRALKQLFPTKYNHVDAVGSEGVKPHAQLALLEHYIRTTRLKSLCRSMLVSGDVEGQWNLYIDWKKDSHWVSGLVRGNASYEGVELVDPVEKAEDIEDEELTGEGPTLADFATEDLVVLPPTCNDIERADATCIKLRLSKGQVRELVDKGYFILDHASEDLADWVDTHKGTERTNPARDKVGDAGLKTEGTLKYALIYEAHVRLEFEKGKKSLAYVYFSGEDEILGIVKAPQWGQKRPILSASVERIAESFFGRSKIEPVKWMQWSLNDAWNIGMDSGTYSLLPIVMTDPVKNPNYAMMVIGLAGVWPVDPNSTKLVSFPQLWKESMAMVEAIKQQIHQSLDVNESMMGRVPQGRKNNAAVGVQQQEQAVSVTDHAERFEEEILNPLMERFFEYDAQFREDALETFSQGEIGVRAAMTKIEPQQWGERYFFQWTGTDFVMNMQRMQQQIATMNVLRGIPPQQLGGRRLDIAPILEILSQNVFGNELSNQILIDEREKLSVPAAIEDEMMVNGIRVEVHPADDDIGHLQEHMVAGQKTGDPQGFIRAHMQAHMAQLMRKRQAAAPPPGQQGVPGGAGPGVPGTPRIGAQPQMPRPGQQPPGGIHPDAMLGAPGR